MLSPRERDTLKRHLARTIRRELASGVTHWTSPSWNQTARDVLLTPFRDSSPGWGQAAVGSAPEFRGTAPERRRPVGTDSARAPRGSQGGGTVRATAGNGGRSGRPKFGPAPKASGRARDWKKQLAAVGEEAAGCTKCGLCETRTNVVFETGNASVPLVFIGEAPGRDEDAQGIPFVGRAGQLLTKIIEAMGLQRDEVYICNVLKCRPPNNRDPEPDEVSSCLPFLERQLEILKPRVICALGRHSAQTLLGRKIAIGRERGRVLLYQGIKMVPTYHPAALLRNPGLKRTVWEDVQLVRKILDDPDSVEAEGAPAAEAEPRSKSQSLGL